MQIGQTFVAPFLAWGGLITWLWLEQFLKTRGIIGEIETIVCFAILVLAPLQLDMYRAQHLLNSWLPCALLGAAGWIVFPDGGFAAALFVLPWLVLSCAGALLALRRLLERGLYPIAETVQDIGFLYWPVGAIWLLASRANLELMGFPGKIVILTAVHFHFAGLAAPLLVGQLGRFLEYDSGRAPSFSYRLAALMITFGIPLTAAGIAGSPWLEWLSALAIASGLFLMAALISLRVLPALLFSRKPVQILSGMMLAIATFSVLHSMFFAVRFATGELFGKFGVNIDDMIRLHGWWNALGFAGCALVALSMLRWPARQFPRVNGGTGFFSRLSSGNLRLSCSMLENARVGRDFFERYHLLAKNGFPEPRGLVDDLRFYDTDEFQSQSLHADIRAFYENTKTFSLSVTPDWRWFMRGAAAFYHRNISSKLEQMNFPIVASSKSPESSTAAITSRILKLDDAADGRRGVRAWIRHYTESGQAIYAAAYTSHRFRGRAFMNIAFPVPGGSITSILRVAHDPTPGNAGAIILSSRPHPAGPGDEGVYYVHVNSERVYRLPINETICVYAAGMAGARAAGLACDGELFAVHRMWLFGLAFLRLDYCMRRN